MDNIGTIISKHNKKIFLDVTFKLSNGTYYPYRKPNDHPLYINVESNHPPPPPPTSPSSYPTPSTVESQTFPATKKNSTKLRLPTTTPSNPVDTQQAFPTTNTDNDRPNRNRKRNIIWYNPPFNSSVKTNIGKTFLKLVSKHFPQQHKYHTLFNKNNIKVSYSSMKNMGTIISKHNKKILSNNNTNDDNDKLCNCRSQQNCPLENKYLTPT